MDDETQMVVVSGDVDLKTARQFRDAIQDAAEEGKPRLVVDLSDVPFMDSSGLAALIGAHKTLRSRVKVVVICPPNLQRIFEVTRLNTVVPVVGTLAEALVA